MGLRKSTTPLTPAQLEIMEIIWAERSGTVASIWNQLHARRGLARNTIQTTLVRLEEKGYLRRKREKNGDVYFPRNRRETVVRGMLQGLLDAAFAGSVSGLMLALLEKQQLSRDEVERIQALLAKHSPRDEEEA